jgi:energy-converting hydrogenase Eha subunit E
MEFGSETYARLWERLGVLGSIYRLVGHGLSDSDIARTLNLTEPTVRGCIGWILRFLQFKERSELIWYSSGASPTFGSL